MSLLLEGKRAFVSGGTRGIGAAICEVFAREGADVAFNYHSSDALADEVRAKIQKEWLKTYDRLVRRGVPVAAVLNGTCQGCRVRIPPQVNNILARGESMQTCERCGRIIYRQELIDGPAQPAAPAGSPPAAE